MSALEPGAELPAQRYPVRRSDLIRYAGASGDFNPIHWSDRVATSVGLPGVIAHGMFTMALAARAVEGWAEGGEVVELGCKFTNPVVVPDDDEGVEVEVADGEMARRARLVNQAFRKHARTGRPWVLFKSAMTLDGKVATRAGDSQWISDESSRARAHRWRASVDAVAVGIGTALADDPALTARTRLASKLPSITRPR